MLTNALKRIGLAAIFKNILQKNNKIINYVDNFFIFPMKMILKLS